jgi:hypothetical protein
MPKSFASELPEEWSEPGNECMGLNAPIEAARIPSHQPTYAGGSETTPAAKR